ncbi:hypothetical protein PENSPDRAFT_760252 [Peniophora sp. CONT]|nr:hypothetical protein PENSPDRAFT_760252 [Peniophora sp. CONT]
MLAISLLAIFALSCLAHSPHSFTRNSSTPSEWNATISLTSLERQTLANDAAAQLLPAINPLTGRIDSLGFSSQDVNLAAVLALQDYHSGTHLYEKTLENMFSVYFSTHNNSFLSSLPVPPPSHGNNEDIQWGLSAFYAYRAYSNETFYNIAKESWERVSAYFVGAPSTRSVAFNGSCPTARAHLGEGLNLGAVFMYTDETSDTTVNTQTMGPFMTLSAYLYESNTSNTQYLAYANLTGNYLHRHLYNGTIMLDTTDVATCLLDKKTVLTYNTGYTLEGIAVLANLSKGADNGLGMYSDWLDTMAPAAINFPGWTGSDGIIFEENADPDNWQSGLKAVLVRGLLEARTRNPDAEWASLADDFITVQFNALLGSGTNNTYSTNWRTISNGTLDYPGSITAMDVLNAAIVTKSSDRSFSSFHEHDGNSHGGGRHRSKTTIIIVVVAIVVALVALAVIAALVIFARRRRKKRAASLRELRDFDIEEPPLPSVEPFTLAKRPLSFSTSPVKEKGMQLPHYPTLDPYSWAGIYRTPSGRSAPSSDVGTSTSAEPQEPTITQSEASAILVRLNAMLNRSPAMPVGVHRPEKDTQGGAPPPGYSDTTT